MRNLRLEMQFLSFPLVQMTAPNDASDFQKNSVCPLTQINFYVYLLHEMKFPVYPCSSFLDVEFYVCP